MKATDKQSKAANLPLRKVKRRIGPFDTDAAAEAAWDMVGPIERAVRRAAESVSQTRSQKRPTRSFYDSARAHIALLAAVHKVGFGVSPDVWEDAAYVLRTIVGDDELSGSVRRGAASQYAFVRGRVKETRRNSAYRIKRKPRKLPKWARR